MAQRKIVDVRTLFPGHGNDVKNGQRGSNTNTKVTKPQPQAEPKVVNHGSEIFFKSDNNGVSPKKPVSLAAHVPRSKTSDDESGVREATRSTPPSNMGRQQRANSPAVRQQQLSTPPPNGGQTSTMYRAKPSSHENKTAATKTTPGRLISLPPPPAVTRSPSPGITIAETPPEPPPLRPNGGTLLASPSSPPSTSTPRTVTPSSPPPPSAPPPPLVSPSSPPTPTAPTLSASSPPPTGAPPPPLVGPPPPPAPPLPSGGIPTTRLVSRAPAAPTTDPVTSPRGRDKVVAGKHPSMGDIFQGANRGALKGRLKDIVSQIQESDVTSSPKPQPAHHPQPGKISQELKDSLVSKIDPTPDYDISGKTQHHDNVVTDGYNGTSPPSPGYVPTKADTAPAFSAVATSLKHNAGTENTVYLPTPSSPPQHADTRPTRHPAMTEPGSVRQDQHPSPAQIFQPIDVDVQVRSPDARYREESPDGKRTVYRAPVSPTSDLENAASSVSDSGVSGLSSNSGVSPRRATQNLPRSGEQDEAFEEVEGTLHFDAEEEDKTSPVKDNKEPVFKEYQGEDFSQYLDDDTQEYTSEPIAYEEVPEAPPRYRKNRSGSVGRVAEEGGSKGRTSEYHNHYHQQHQHQHDHDYEYDDRRRASTSGLKKLQNMFTISRSSKPKSPKFGQQQRNTQGSIHNFTFADSKMATLTRSREPENANNDFFPRETLSDLGVGNGHWGEDTLLARTLQRKKSSGRRSQSMSDMLDNGSGPGSVCSEPILDSHKRRGSSSNGSKSGAKNFLQKLSRTIRRRKKSPEKAGPVDCFDPVEYTDIRL